MCPNLSAIDMTEKEFFERLYSIPGLGTFGPGVNCPCAPTPPPFTEQLFLDFRIFPEWPRIFQICTEILENFGTSTVTLYKRHDIILDMTSDRRSNVA